MGEAAVPQHLLNSVSPSRCKSPIRFVSDVAGALHHSPGMVASTAVTANASALESKGRSRPILVVEDETDLLNTYERVLRRLNLDVIAVARAADGLRVAESRRIRLVITDLKLPDMDGIALIRALRAGAAPPPIIVASGLDSAAARRSALEAGAIAYLTKPFSVTALTAKVEEVLKGLDDARS